MNNKESKKLIYKLASGTLNGETLQDGLTNALWRFKRPSSRVEPLTEESNEVRFVNVRRPHKGMLIGLFHKLTKGASQLIINMGESGKDADAWEVVPVKAKRNDAEANEFIQGTLFFGLWKNHVILHQTNACRADQFQDHATWLLNKFLEDQSDGPVTAPLIYLSDPLPPDLRRKSAMQAKKVTLGASAISSELVPRAKSPTSTGTMNKVRDFFTPTGDIWGAIKMIFAARNAKLPEEILLDDSLSEDVRVYIELSTPKSRTESSAGTLLGAIGRSLSHSDIDYRVELADGSTYGPTHMKVEKVIRVECHDRQPEVERMFASMVDWMAELVESKRVVEQEPFGNLK
jgi:hypothetical protein